VHPGTLSNHPSAEVLGTKSCCKANEASPAPTAPRVFFHGETTMHIDTCDCLPEVACIINCLKVLSFTHWASILQWVGTHPSPQGEQSPPVMRNTQQSTAKTNINMLYKPTY